jgi:hypothetical protein
VLLLLLLVFCISCHCQLPNLLFVCFGFFFGTVAPYHFAGEEQKPTTTIKKEKFLGVS